MQKYMVAIDGSTCCEDAFHTACSMLNKTKDTVYLITCVQTFPLGFGPFDNYNKQLEKVHRNYLEDYAERCESHGLKYHCILAKGSHVGGLLCKAVEEKGIDYLVLGRRGMNKFSRIVMGSTSKYCVENANSNVIVVKGSFSLPECHDSLSKVKKMEEKERQRRYKKTMIPVEGHESRKDVIQLEEEERKRRIKEEKLEGKQQRHREAQLIKDAVLEERTVRGDPENLSE